MTELEEMQQPFHDLRACADARAIHNFMFIEKDVDRLTLAARLRAVALELELTASHLHRVLEEGTL